MQRFGTQGSCISDFGLERCSGVPPLDRLPVRAEELGTVRPIVLFWNVLLLIAQSVFSICLGGFSFTVCPLTMRLFHRKLFPSQLVFPESRWTGDAQRETRKLALGDTPKTLM